MEGGAELVLVACRRLRSTISRIPGLQLASRNLSRQASNSITGGGFDYTGHNMQAAKPPLHLPTAQSWPWAPRAPRTLAAAAVSNGSSTHYPLAIVGGGLGGLTAARVLQVHGLDVALFEREPSRGARDQGGMLDLRPETGQWALAAAGLTEEFRAISHPEGQDLRVLDASGAVLLDEVGPPGEMTWPEVPRAQLRAMLLDSLTPGTVRWDHQLQEIQPDGGGGRHALRFANGTSATADLVIGADGARSLVRPLLTPARPSYTGVSFVEIYISDPDRFHPAMAKLVGRGSMFALGDCRGLLAQRNVDAIRVYVALRVPEGRGGFAQLGIEFGDNPAVTRAALAAQFRGWAPELTALLDACDDVFLPRPLYAMPTGLSWPARPGLTLLGDAAHVMSPFAGAGANLAMQDGAEMALQLAAAGGDPARYAQAIRTYEEGMFERAEEEAQQSAQGLETCMAPDGAARLARLMQQLLQQHD